MAIRKGMSAKGIFILLCIGLAVLCLHASVRAEGQFGTITTDELKQMIDGKQKFLLIDARSPQEYKDAHITGAVNIPDKEFEANKKLLPEDKNSLIVIYCNGVKCGKSKRLATQVEPLGYQNITIYSEGMPVWEERSLSIVAGPEYGKKIETKKVACAELQKMIAEKRSDYVLVDVRDVSEFKEGHIPTAINIPADKFASESSVLPKEMKVIVYCNTGSRSYLAYRKLISLSYPDIYQTLFADWKDAGMTVVK